MFFLINHILKYLLTISKYTQLLIYRRLKLIFSMVLIYLWFGQKAGSFQSISKTQLLHLGTSITVHTCLINGINMLPVDKVLDLGIITDHDPNFSSINHQ